jgi:GR25 family glycosyltransferase involved in LPS biosynthesis
VERLRSSLSSQFDMQLFHAYDGRDLQLPRGFCVAPGWRMTEDAVRRLAFSGGTPADALDTALQMWTKDLTAGEVCCAVSHFSMWKQQVERKLPVVMFMEDDSVIESRYATMNLQLFLRSLAGVNWSIARVGRSTADCTGLLSTPRAATVSDRAVSFTATVSDRAALREKLTHVFAGTGSWTGCYILTLRGAERLVASGFERALFNVDDFLFCLSAVHPRTDLMDSAPVRAVRSGGEFLSVCIRQDLQRRVFGIDMDPVASARGDCFVEDID